jgi:hypothetical protein
MLVTSRSEFYFSLLLAYCNLAAIDELKSRCVPHEGILLLRDHAVVRYFDAEPNRTEIWMKVYTESRLDLQPALVF